MENRNNITAKEETPLQQVLNRVQSLEEQVRLINLKLQFQEMLPDFEFTIETEGEELWSGKDLQMHYQEIRHKYPDRDIVINWRSSPVTFV